MATTVYDIGILAFRELLYGDPNVHDVRVGDYVVAINACSKGIIYFQAPALVIFHDLGSALDSVMRREQSDLDLIVNIAYEYEIWHVVADVPYTDELLDDYVFPEMHAVEYHVYLSDEECVTPKDVVNKRVGKCTFSIYMDAEDFAVRNVCEGIPSVLITNSYDAYWGVTVEDAVRFLRWSGDSVKLSYRPKTFCTGECRIFELPTKNGSIHETLSGFLNLCRAGDR